MSRMEALILWIYRGLLRLYPAAYRDLFATAMEVVLRAVIATAAARRSAPELLAIAFWEAIGLLWGAAIEQVCALGEHRKADLTQVRHLIFCTFCLTAIMVVDSQNVAAGPVSLQDIGYGRTWPGMFVLLVSGSLLVASQLRIAWRSYTSLRN